ncbi:MAG: T9SS type A sorting domain-containing protein [Parafilimonas sp.]
MKKYLLGCLLLLVCILSKEKILAQSAAKINAAEYFFDLDPGIGNALPISVNISDTVLLNLNLATTNLSGGFHQLFVRFEDANNLWSIAEQRTFYIDAAKTSKPAKLRAGEYFFDKDPGIAKATALGAINTDSVNMQYSLSIGTLKAGFHQLFIRYKDSSNHWSIAEQRSFYIDKDSLVKAKPIIAAEYFFTKDPGVGKGTPLIISKTDSINQTFNITVPNLSLGKQFLEIRFKDSSGKWSIAESRKITIVNSLNSNETSSVIVQNKPSILNVYPNPTSGNAYLVFNAVKEEKVSIVIKNVSGKALLKKEIVAVTGTNKILLDLSELIPGAYFINIINEKLEQQTLKIIKQ